MTPEEAAREARIDLAQDELRKAMSRLPFDIQTAGAIRVNVWKALRLEAEKMLRRNVREPSRYEDATRKLRACGDAPVEAIVKGVYEDKEGKP